MQLAPSAFLAMLLLALTWSSSSSLLTFRVPPPPLRAGLMPRLIGLMATTYLLLRVLLSGCRSLGTGSESQWWLRHFWKMPPTRDPEPTFLWFPQERESWEHGCRQPQSLPSEGHGRQHHSWMTTPLKWPLAFTSAPLSADHTPATTVVLRWTATPLMASVAAGVRAITIAMQPSTMLSIAWPRFLLTWNHQGSTVLTGREHQSPGKEESCFFLDTTCSDTFIPSYISNAAYGVRAVAAQAETTNVKYQHLDISHSFTPVLVETSSVFGPDACLFEGPRPPHHLGHWGSEILFLPHTEGVCGHSEGECGFCSRYYWGVSSTTYLMICNLPSSFIFVCLFVSSFIVLLSLFVFFLVDM